VITEPVLINIAPKIIIKIVANRFEQLAVVIIRKINEIGDQICGVVSAAWIIPLVFAIPGHSAFDGIAVFAPNPFLDEFRYLADWGRYWFLRGRTAE
jgi:hypothetical protein